MLIREISEADVGAYRAIRLEALQAHPDAFGSDFEESSREPESYWHERVQQSCGAGHGRIIVADTGRTLVATVGVYRHGGLKGRHIGGIWGVYVRPEFRGRNLTVRLMTEAIAWSKSQGIEDLRLAVSTHNRPAIDCYARCGFRVYGVSPREIRLGDRYVDELLMRRSLIDG